VGVTALLVRRRPAATDEEGMARRLGAAVRGGLALVAGLVAAAAVVGLRPSATR
jgi:hypothetical protein